ncbi:M3 family metallopeptidase [Pseudonocardia halophobica]|uniref:Peptidyl-dipeptidase Dcp n=1 Tax=Pseudonocardia halophobica TaxID=29401 RepID=A0A9W6L0P2_9PSEU|nr:M3 family metallopeptidase [Pseudonocardia halophobica]GLL08889.1 peptidyl-dipeptidase Dcp [Pseudonocardia halophobica]
MANPFLVPSELPYGLPDFAAITDEDYLPAFEAGMAEQRAEVDAILDSGPPTFADTIEALELSGRTLDRVSRVFFSRAGAHTTPKIEEVRAAVAPMLAAHADAIALDPRLFARIAELHGKRGELGLDPESLRLLERHHRDAVRAGAELGEADKERLSAINAELSSLSTTFSGRLLAGANAAAVHVHDPAKLDGMSPGAISAAAAAAKDRGHGSGFLITLVLPTGQPVLESLTDRELRREIFEASIGRGAQGDENDTRDVVLRLAALRAERARLLGFPSHAAYVIDDNTAASVDAVAAMLADLAPPAMRNADTEAADLAAIAGHALEPWDWAFYAERVRRERYEVDAALLRPYLELERVLQHGVFHAAEELYGIQFHERHDLPTYHPDVRYWEVFDADGTPLGLYGGDYYARESKRGGAWMNALVPQAGLLGTRPVVMNTLNIAKPAEGEPTLLTIDEVRTLFHEFGHALHGLFSAVRYPTFSGTSVPRDFVEFPSQVNEMWLERPEILRRYARHHETGEPLPPELLEKLLASRAYGEGYRTTEYLAASLLDQAWHTLSVDDTVEDVLAFEAEALRKAGIAHPLVPPRYRSTYFNHVFAGGYSAGYYSYIWSEVLDADTVEWFAENGGLRRENGDHFRRELLSRGGSVDAMAAYRAFRGRDPEIRPLLERRNLT